MKLKCTASIEGCFTEGREYPVVSIQYSHHSGSLGRLIIVDEQGDHRKIWWCNQIRKYFEVVNEK